MTAPPAFQFYASDFVSGTMAFNAEQTGAYILLLCYQWMSGKVPDDDAALAVIGKCSSTALAVVKTKFVTASDGFGLVNLRLEEVRTTQNHYRAKQAENGRKGGLLTKHRSRTAKATTPATLPATIPANTQPESSSPSPSPSPSPISDLRSPISTLLRSLGELYGRNDGSRASYADEHTAAFVVQRTGWEQELTSIVAWYNAMKPEDRKYRPQSVSSLLERWQDNVDRAHSNKPPPVKRFGTRGFA